MILPGDDHKITNADEQSVAVNASTTDDGGYDEPVNRNEAKVKAESEQKEKPEKEKKHEAGRPPHHRKVN
jgi:hypothetical protein